MWCPCQWVAFWKFQSPSTLGSFYIVFQKITIFNGKTYYKWPFYNSYFDITRGYFRMPNKNGPGALPASPHSPACAAIPRFWASPKWPKAVRWSQLSPESYPHQSCWYWGILNINHGTFFCRYLQRAKLSPSFRVGFQTITRVMAIPYPRYTWNMANYIRVINTFTNHLQVDIFHHGYRGTVSELVRARV